MVYSFKEKIDFLDIFRTGIFSLFGFLSTSLEFIQVGLQIAIGFLTVIYLAVKIILLIKGKKVE